MHMSNMTLNFAWPHPNLERQHAQNILYAAAVQCENKIYER
jgi:hypothetical protein